MVLGEMGTFFEIHLNFVVILAGRNETAGSHRTMADFCQQIPVSIEQLLRVGVRSEKAIS